jgi:peptide/nickel transport system permease protein
VFGMVQLVPGDPIVSAFGDSATALDLQRLHHEYGLDKPLYDQFATYVGHALHGDFGRGFQTQQPVGQLIHQRAGSSLQLAVSALLIVLFVGVPLGVLAAVFTREGRHRRAEVGFASITSILGSIPDYLTATVLVFFFAVLFRLLPVAGSEGFKSLILPALAVSMAPSMILARIVRLETLNVLAQDYIRTARSERLPARIVYVRHTLPNVLTAALTFGGLIFSGIIGSAVVVENVFARNGLGTALVSAVQSKDYPVIQGITLVLATAVVLTNTVVDILLGILDPKSLAKR